MATLDPGHCTVQSVKDDTRPGPGTIHCHCTGHVDTGGEDTSANTPWQPLPSVLTQYRVDTAKLKNEPVYALLHHVSTHIELELGVEVLVGHHVHLAHQRVHVALVRHQPDDGGLAAGLVLGLRVVLEPLAHGLNHLQQVLLRPRIGNLQTNSH